MEVTQPRLVFMLLIMVVVFLSACGNVTPVPLPPTPTVVPATEVLTSLPPPTPTASPTATPTPLPLNLHPQIVVLAENLPEPDDLVLAPDGSIYVSDVTDNTIKVYTPDGQLKQFLAGLSAPEGMAFLPDGSMIIAEQGKNRLLRYAFQTQLLEPFLDLVNHTNNLGVDGIIWNGTNLIIPDSPNGTILEVSPDGKTVQQLASGLTRPTGVWIEPTGNLLIADEYGNAIVRLHPDGILEKVADFSIPDDVIADNDGNIFVVTLGDDAVHVIMADTGQDVILTNGLIDPQGIIFDASGNLIVTDSGNHQLLKLIIH